MNVSTQNQSPCIENGMVASCILLYLAISIFSYTNLYSHVLFHLVAFYLNFLQLLMELHLIGSCCFLLQFLSSSSQGKMGGKYAILPQFHAVSQSLVVMPGLHDFPFVNFEEKCSIPQFVLLIVYSVDVMTTSDCLRAYLLHRDSTMA